MNKSLILAVAAAAIVAVGCDQQKNARTDRTVDSEKDNIQKSVREAKSEVDKSANAQKDMLEAEAKSARASLDAEKARAKAEATPSPQASVDAAGAVSARVQTEVGAAKNATPSTVTPSISTPTPPIPVITTPSPTTTTVSETDQKLVGLVRTAVLGENAAANAATTSAIEISATGGTVTLKGSVKSEEEKTRMETAAKAVSGVTKVDNQLQVKAE